MAAGHSVGSSCDGCVRRQFMASVKALRSIGAIRSKSWRTEAVLGSHGAESGVHASQDDCGAGAGAGAGAAKTAAAPAKDRTSDCNMVSERALGKQILRKC